MLGIFGWVAMKTFMNPIALREITGLTWGCVWLRRELVVSFLSWDTPDESL